MSPFARRIAIASSLLVGSLIILALYFPGIRPQPGGPATVSGAAAIGGPFTLTNQKGETVTEASLKGHYSLVYLGFTNCPDICPLSLQNVTQALEIAGPVAETLVPVFISVDAERDTSEVMAAYLANFHPRFVGLTGTPEQVAQAAKGYRAYYAKVKAKDGGPDYGVEHSGYLFLMNENGEYVHHFGMDATPQDIAARLRRELSPR